MKFYCNKEDLNEYETKHNRVSYRRLIERIGDIWFFPKTLELSGYELQYLLNDEYDPETNEVAEICQYYLLDINDYTLNKLIKIGCKDLIIAWSDKLEQYILCVEHCGTSWDYVLTEFEPTEEFEKADI